jgi:hypothetical protein
MVKMSLLTSLVEAIGNLYFFILMQEKTANMPGRPSAEAQLLAVVSITELALNLRQSATCRRLQIPLASPKMTFHDNDREPATHL